jgi:hypothetical protein
MKRVVQTFEEFIGDKSNPRTWKEKITGNVVGQPDTWVLPDENTNDPEQEYDDENDGGDNVNGSVV